MIFGFSRRVTIGVTQVLVLPIVGTSLDGSPIVRGESGYYEVQVCKGAVRYAWQTATGVETDLTLIPLSTVSNTVDPLLGLNAMYRGDCDGWLFLTRDSAETEDAIVKISFPGFDKTNLPPRGA